MSIPLISPQNQTLPAGSHKRPLLEWDFSNGIGPFSFYGSASYQISELGIMPTSFGSGKIVNALGYPNLLLPIPPASNLFVEYLGYPVTGASGVETGLEVIFANASLKGYWTGIYNAQSTQDEIQITNNGGWPGASVPFGYLIPAGQPVTASVEVRGSKLRTSYGKSAAQVTGFQGPITWIGWQWSRTQYWLSRVRVVMLP